MAYFKSLLGVLRSGASATTAVTIGATGSYVAFKDHNRFPRMMSAYCRGCILPPLEENNYQMNFFHRPDLEAELKMCMSSTLSNDYHLVTGEIGSGKSRLIQEVIREMMVASAGKGAPVYVSASQGKSFADMLAAAVHFEFDEHISFKFFLDYVLGIHSFPKRDDAHRLTRVLDAIEKSACAYLKATGKPAVLVIDETDTLLLNSPKIMQRLQEKAKLWADTNIVKVVFVSSDDGLLHELQHSGWSRAAPAISIGDVSDTEAVAFLTSPCKDTDTVSPISKLAAESIVSLVGGRLNYLRVFKRDHQLGIGLNETMTGLLRKGQVLGCFSKSLSMESY
jgi:hypothetical protein